MTINEAPTLRAITEAGATAARILHGTAKLSLAHTSPLAPVRPLPAPTPVQRQRERNEALLTRHGNEYFDGQAVDRTRVKLTACTNLDDVTAYALEEEITLTIKGQVTGIDHRVDKRTGDLIRMHTITVTQIVEKTSSTVEIDDGEF